jgi:hypothetical protein
MKLRTLLLLSALSLGAPVIGGSVLAFADNAPVASPTGEHPGRPSPAVMQHLADGRIAYIETALSLNSDQQKLWQPVADLLRQESAARAAMWQGHKADDHKPGEQADLSDVLSRHAQAMSDHAADDQKLATALKSLEASLTAEQKQTLKIAFFSSLPHMMHHRGFDAGHGAGHDGGMMQNPDAAPADGGSQG